MTVSLGSPAMQIVVGSILDSKNVCHQSPFSVGASWEIDLQKAYKHVMKTGVKFPTGRAVTRTSIGLCPRIVIPVVVGSSPISHPKISVKY